MAERASRTESSPVSGGRGAVGIIPARYASTRFPGKPLVMIQGKTMTRRVYEQASRASTLSEVLVATDDRRIFDEVKSFGGQVMMTSLSHACGTDRLAEVAEAMPDVAIFVNIQGDEPLIAPESIDLAVNRLADQTDADISTLVSPCGPEAYADPNVVKAVLDLNGRALYFSRAPIPYQRSGGADPKLWRHIGLYAYRREFLLTFAAAPPTPLEQTECLEQLRALEMGRRIVCAVSPYPSIGVDTPDDVAGVVSLIRAAECE